MLSMEKKVKLSNTVIKTVVDKDTGEVIEELVENKPSIGREKEEFSIVYNNMFFTMLNLSGLAIKVCCYLMTQNKSGVPIVINKFVKANIRKALESKSVGAISNALSDLVGAKVLIKDMESKGIYYINPLMMYKGSSYQRRRVVSEMIGKGFELY